MMMMNDPVLTVWEAGWAAGPVWSGAENRATNAILSPDRPAGSKPLYVLRYPDPNRLLLMGTKLGRSY